MANVIALTAEQPLAEYNGKPEIDDGHTKIANELLDAIIGHEFSKRQLKILLFIMRKTYGWNKSEDDISRSQITEATGLLNPHVTTSLQELQAENVIIITQGNHAKRYKINKYYDQWRVTNLVTITKTVPLTETVTITETVTDRYQNGNFSLPKQYPQKTTPKDNTKDSENADANFDAFWSAYPKKVDKKKALSAWNKSKPKTEDVMAALEWQKKSKSWIEGFIPNPTTYINGERWNDEPASSDKKQSSKISNEFLNGMEVI